MQYKTQIWRDRHGVPHVEASTEEELFQGMGYCHARDRGMQMLLMRILGQGRGSEFLDASEDMLKIDRFFRKMNWYGAMDAEICKMSSSAKTLCEAYCRGVNDCLTTTRPWELKLLGYHPEPWRLEDSVLMARMIGYLTLAQAQGEIERLLLEMVQAGVALQKIEELFPGLLKGLDVALIKKTKLQERLVPPELLWQVAAPCMMSSNNWVVAGSKTVSGSALLANDPHLETNRIPSVWCELVLARKDWYAMGATIPGLPAILIGRTPVLAWGVTYTFADAIDGWIEDCQDGKYRRDQEWLPFHERKEVILRKNKAPVEEIFYENSHGVLEGNPREPGFYLTTLWAAAQSGGNSVEAMLNIWHAQHVEDGMKLLGRLETSWNWVLADKHGHIGYQMSGLVPKRRPGISGLVALPGWQPENDWVGFWDLQDLPRYYNPAEGYFVTANQNLNEFGRAKPCNMTVGHDRSDRITQLLKQKPQLTPEEMMEVQMDVYSLQAERYMKVLKTLLPDTAQGKILRDWDCRYTPESQGAYLFEQFYQELLAEVFGRQGLGHTVFQYLLRETGLLTAFYDNFDRILLAEQSNWFQDEKRETIYVRALTRALGKPACPWGKVNRIQLSHLLFGNKLPRILGFDRGPVPLRGGRATVHQGQIYRSAGRTTSFAPSFRMVTELRKDEIHTCMAGGPSDRRFSRWYCTGLRNWLRGNYKKLMSQGKQRKYKM